MKKIKRNKLIEFNNLSKEAPYLIFKEKYNIAKSVGQDNIEAMCVSSSQSKPISSYHEIKRNFNKSIEENYLKKCPNYWRSYSFEPYSFKFWEGRESKIT